MLVVGLHSLGKQADQLDDVWETRDGLETAALVSDLSQEPAAQGRTW
jgi:hypothetical protein